MQCMSEHAHLILFILNLCWEGGGEAGIKTIAEMEDKDKKIWVRILKNVFQI